MWRPGGTVSTVSFAMTSGSPERLSPHPPTLTFFAYYSLKEGRERGKKKKGTERYQVEKTW